MEPTFKWSNLNKSPVGLSIRNFELRLKLKCILIVMCNMQIEPGADPGFSEGRVRIRGDRVLSFIVATSRLL